MFTFVGETNLRHQTHFSDCKSRGYLIGAYENVFRIGLHGQIKN